MGVCHLRIWHRRHGRSDLFECIADYTGCGLQRAVDGVHDLHRRHRRDRHGGRPDFGYAHFLSHSRVSLGLWGVVADLVGIGSRGVNARRTARPLGPVTRTFSSRTLPPPAAIA